MVTKRFTVDTVNNAKKSNDKLTPIVMDTSVIAAALFRSRAKEIIALWQKGRLRLCYSPAILDEYKMILKRIPPIRIQAKKFIGELEQSEFSVLCNHPKKITIEIEDQADKKFIECAVETGAEYIVSLDAHLLDLREYSRIPIIRPVEFLCRWSRCNLL